MTLHRAPLPVQCVYYGTEAPLPPDVLPGIPDETVKALVDCLVITIFLAVTTKTVIGVAYAPPGVRVTLVLTGKLASSTAGGPCPTDVSVTPFV